MRWCSGRGVRGKKVGKGKVGGIEDKGVLNRENQRTVKLKSKIGLLLLFLRKRRGKNQYFFIVNS